MLADMLTPEQLIAIIHALADAAPCFWPIALVTLVIVFRSEVRDFIGRLRRGKVFGQEIELDEQIALVQASVAETVAGATSSPNSETPKTRTEADFDHARLSGLRVICEIMDEASPSPLSAYLRALLEIDRRLSDITKLLTGSKAPELIVPAEATKLLDALDPEELTPAGRVILPNIRKTLRGYSSEREKSVTAAAREPDFARGSLIPVLRMIMLLNELLMLVESRALRKPLGSDGGA